MKQHGSEGFFVIGEGFPGETARGRELTLGPDSNTFRMVDLLLGFGGRKSLLAPLG